MSCPHESRARKCKMCAMEDYHGVPEDHIDGGGESDVDE